jgi:hypothetical protein
MEGCKESCHSCVPFCHLIFIIYVRHLYHSVIIISFPTSSLCLLAEHISHNPPSHPLSGLATVCLCFSPHVGSSWHRNPNVHMAVYLAVPLWCVATDWELLCDQPQDSWSHVGLLIHTHAHTQSAWFKVGNHGCYSRVRGLKSQLHRCVGLAVRLKVACDLWESNFQEYFSSLGMAEAPMLALNAKILVCFSVSVCPPKDSLTLMIPEGALSMIAHCALNPPHPNLWQLQFGMKVFNVKMLSLTFKLMSTAKTEGFG